MARSGIASNIKNKNIGEERYRVLQAVLEPRFITVITEGGREVWEGSKYTFLSAYFTYRAKENRSTNS